MQNANSATAQLLQLAYERPCLICKREGACKHREPAVELAMLRAEAMTAAAWMETKARRAAA